MEYLFLVILVIGVILFVVTHLRPLTKDELLELSFKKRGKKVREYFSFANHETTVDKTFKKRMNPNGKFYRAEQSLRHFPSTAAALLKYKKHEWIIVAFEKKRTIELFWLNKGFDRSSVSSFLSPEDMIQTAQGNGYSSILIFHNHPNSNPQYYSCTRPSDMDLESARESSIRLNDNGINLVEFVCERGRHYQYFSKISNQFLPATIFYRKLQGENGQSKLGNLSLHLQRLI